MATVDIKRFNRSGGVGIPTESLKKYQQKKASLAETIEGATPVVAAPRTTQARVVAAPHVAGAAQSERERSWWRGTLEDPALLVGVGVCAFAYIAVRFMRR